jgi:hypothetical protein
VGLFCHTHDRENSGFCVQQGTYVEGIKEEVVLSPAHALSLIAAGEGTSTLLQTLHLLEVTMDCKICPLALVTRPLSYNIRRFFMLIDEDSKDLQNPWPLESSHILSVPFSGPELV